MVLDVVVVVSFVFKNVVKKKRKESTLSGVVVGLKKKAMNL